jgi:acyl-CoA synthetase (AMP-forming)/AMP-acid ligase II
MNLVSELLANGAPNAVAVCAGPAEVTYAELREQVERAARTLLARGLRRQDRIAIWSENSVFFVVSYLAVIRAGMVAVPLPADSSRETGLRTLRDAQVSAILVSPRYRAQVTEWLMDAGVAVLSEADFLAPVALHEGPLPEGTDQDLAALMFTSGSTGQPKGVMVTHRNIACNTRDIVSYLGLTSSDRCLVVLPFYYCFGLSLLHTHLAVGASVVINNQFMYPEKVLQELNDRACTGLAGVPSTFQILLRKSRFAQSTFPSLRWLQQAGGRLPNPCIREIIDAFPDVRFYVMYGQTEGTARLSYLPPDWLREKIGSIGMGLPSTRIEVLRSDDQPVTPGSDEIGEIVASGDNIAAGYWNDPNETAKYFRGGRLHTGDLARVDADGFVYVVARDREVIKCGGNRVSAREVEDVISELPGVVEVAVVGTPHEILGEAIVAFVTVSAGADSEAMNILEHCRGRLPPSRNPETVVYLPGLPHSGNGKILRASLVQFALDLTKPIPDHEAFRPIRIEHRTTARHGLADAQSRR